MARVLQAFEPPDGGVAAHVAQLALGLGECGHEVEVAGPAGAALWPALRRGGIAAHAIEMPRSYGRPDRDLAAGAALARLLRRGGYDLVHCHASKAGALGRVAAALNGVPAVYSPHCFGFVGDVSAGRRVGATLIERALGRRWTRALICVCEAERRWALEAHVAPAERLWRIYPAVTGCDEAGVEPDPAMTALRGDGLLVGTVSTLRAQKAVGVLIRAARDVLARVPSARVAVVGNGELADELAARASGLGLDRDGRFLMTAFEAPSARYLRAFDVFVLPSAWEAMPAAVLEAMSCGVPVVATDVGGVSEVVDGTTGVLVAPGDSDGMADAIVSLLTNGEHLRETGRAGKARFDGGEFGVGEMVRRTAEVYEAVLASG